MFAGDTLQSNNERFLRTGLCNRKRVFRGGGRDDPRGKQTPFLKPEKVHPEDACV